MPSERARTVAELVAEYHEAVYRYAFRLSGSVPEAEDLTQQVFLTAHEKRHQLRDEANVRPWLFAILRNRFLRERQRRQATPAVDLQVSLESIPSEPPRESEVDPERLQQALGELPDTFRVVVVMYYFEDCSYREIAEALDLPLGTVMSRLARAKGHLRSKLFEPTLTDATDVRFHG